MAINPTVFYDQLASHGVDFFTGVPDSLLKEFCQCIDDRIPNDKHIITANEGNAVALSAGYYLANKTLPLVYMQNSGLGNAVNLDMMLLLNNGNIKIIELPVSWAHRSGSKVHLIKDSIKFFLDLLILKRRLSR